MPKTLVVSNAGTVEYHFEEDVYEDAINHILAEDGDTAEYTYNQQIPGGLSTALNSVDTVGAVASARAPADAYVTDDDHVYINKSPEQHTGQYENISNQYLWFLQHGMLDHVNTDFADQSFDESFVHYTDWNQEAAEKGAALTDGDTDTVLWLQDYHTKLAPQMAAEQVDNPIAWTSHIPWRVADEYADFPESDTLMEGTAGADLVTFHTETDVLNYLDSAAAVGADVDYRNNEFVYDEDGTPTKVAAHPIGIDPDQFTEPDTVDEQEAFRASIAADDIVVAVDRNEPAKANPQKVAGFRQYLEDNPDVADSTTLYQKLSNSRGGLPQYDRELAWLEDEVTQTNEAFGENAVTVENTKLPYDDIIARYREGDAAIVNSIADGMNLVAMEYVAANLSANPDDPGMLVLSEGAGAHELLGDYAVTIEEPDDQYHVAEKLDEALDMPTPEKRRRMHEMYETITNHTVEDWAEDVLQDTENAAREFRTEDFRDQRLNNTAFRVV